MIMPQMAFSARPLAVERVPTCVHELPSPAAARSLRRVAADV